MFTLFERTSPLSSFQHMHKKHSKETLCFTSLLRFSLFVPHWFSGLFTWTYWVACIFSEVNYILANFVTLYTDGKQYRKLFKRVLMIIKNIENDKMHCIHGVLFIYFIIYMHNTWMVVHARKCNEKDIVT